jgi:hypothetical protein
MESSASFDAMESSTSLLSFLARLAAARWALRLNSNLRRRLPFVFGPAT